MIEARAQFFDKLVEHALTHLTETTPNTKRPDDLLRDIVPHLRSEFAYQICQLYFLLDKHKINTAAKFERLTGQHNRDMDDLVQNKQKMILQGLRSNIERIKNSKFTTRRGNEAKLDQSDILKFMAPFMAPESCRKTLLALEKGGLLNKSKGFPRILSSKGNIETYFRDHLRMMADQLSLPK